MSPHTLRASPHKVIRKQAARLSYNKKELARKPPQTKIWCYRASCNDEELQVTAGCGHGNSQDSLQILGVDSPQILEVARVTGSQIITQNQITSPQILEVARVTGSQTITQNQITSPQILEVAQVTGSQTITQDQITIFYF